MVKSICLVRLSALGDVLMFVPLVRAIQAHYPKAQITWVISPLAYQLVEGMEGIDFIVLKKPKTIRDYWAFHNRIKARKFDILLAAQASFRANLLYPLIRASRKIGYDRHKSKDAHVFFVKEHVRSGRYHTLEGFLKFGEQIGIPFSEPKWHMPITQADEQWVHQHINVDQYPVILINPAASKPERSWHFEGYVEVIRAILKRKPVQIVLIGGPGAQDKMFGDAILQRFEQQTAQLADGCSVTNLIGKTKPKQLMALIQKATLVLCPDTGPSHMATAVGTPVVALHAVTNPNISGPYLCLQHVVNAYPKALEHFKKSTPDAIRWGTQVHHPKAMHLITVDDVMSKVEQFI